MIILSLNTTTGQGFKSPHQLQETLILSFMNKGFLFYSNKKLSVRLSFLVIYKINSYDLFVKIFNGVVCFFLCELFTVF